MASSSTYDATVVKVSDANVVKVSDATVVTPSKKVSWLDESDASWFGIVCGVLAFLVPLLLYLATAMHEPDDRGDFAKWAFIGKIRGVPHPTGFPLYVFLNALVSRLDFGTLIFRVTLISTVAVAAGMHLLYRIGRLLGFMPLLALAVALLAASGRPVWGQALTTDVYGLHMCLILAQVWTLLKWDKSDDDRWFRAAIWLFLLGMANHPTTALVLPGLLIFTVVRKPRVYLNSVTWIHATFALLVTIGLYSCIFIRSMQGHLWNEGLFDGPLRGDPHRFWLYITAQDFREQWGMIGTNIPERLWTFYINSVHVLGSYGWLLAVAGILVAAIRDWRRFLLLILVPGGIFACNFLFETSELESWFAPSYPFLALFAGFLIQLSTDYFGGRRGRGKEREPVRISKTGIIIGSIASIVLIVVAISHIFSGLPYVDKSGPSEEYRMAKRMAEAVEAPALIVPHNYDLAMRIMYCFYEDDTRRSEWPQYFGLLEKVDLSEGTLSPIIMKWVWDDDLVRSALERGMRVYVMGPGVVMAHERYWLRIVDTGSEEPEMGEVITGPEAGAVAPEPNSGPSLSN